MMDIPKLPPISQALRERLMNELSKEAEWDGLDRPVNEAVALFDYLKEEE